MAPTTDQLSQLFDRLASIEEKLDRLTAAGSTATVAPPSAGAKRLTTAQAMAALGVSRTTLEGYAARGLLRQIRPTGKRGPNQRVYYLPDEVSALAVSEDAARELMARKYPKRRAK